MIWEIESGPLAVFCLAQRKVPPAWISYSSSWGFGLAYRGPSQFVGIWLSLCVTWRRQLHREVSRRCYRNAVLYEVCADPVDAKICHCSACQMLHGAPMQWAAIFHQRDVRFTAGIEHLHFYNSARGRPERLLPCKVACASCRILIAHEGRNMLLAFPTLFDFGTPPRVPEAFRPTCHIFYAMRVMDITDWLPKWSGHKDKSTLL